MKVIKQVIRFAFMILYIPYCKYVKGFTIKMGTIINANTRISKKCVVNKGCIIPNTQIGYGTYLGTENNLPNTIIGKFCCIANNISVVSATHPTADFVSFHPAFYSLLKQAGFTYTTRQKFVENIFVDNKKKIACLIGNDVWIGANVTIMGGVTIGDGAMIAIGSIVTKDVASYSIVGGVPAKIIKYRFSREQIEFLQSFRWWDKNEDWLRNNVDLFENINLLIKTTNENS